MEIPHAFSEPVPKRVPLLERFAAEYSASFEQKGENPPHQQRDFRQLRNFCQSYSHISFTISPRRLYPHPVKLMRYTKRNSHHKPKVKVFYACVFCSYVPVTSADPPLVNCCSACTPPGPPSKWTAQAHTAWSVMKSTRQAPHCSHRQVLIHPRSVQSS